MGDKGRLSKDDIERMVREAEQFADEDKAAKERIDAKNGLESYCYSMKNTINEEKLKNAEHAEKEEFESMQKDLEAVCNPIITKMYQSAGCSRGWYARWHAWC